MDVVVFTGELTKWTRKEAAAVAEAKGFTVGSSVTKATTILVYGNKAGKKVDDAKKKGIKLFSEQEWEQKLGGGSDDGDQEMVDAEKDEAIEDEGEDGQEEEPASDTNNDVVVFTGALTRLNRKEAAVEAEAKGYTVGSSVTKATTILVCGDKTGKKVEDAKKKGITIYTEEEWAAHLGVDGTIASGGAKKVKATAKAAVKVVTVAKKPVAKRKAEPTEDNDVQQVVVFTGTLACLSRKDATKQAEVKGFRVEQRVTKATNILICGAGAGQKMDAAKKQGVTIFTEDEWQQKLDTMADADDGKTSPRPAKKQAVQVSDSTVELVFDPATAGINGLLPKTCIVDGVFFEIKSASSSAVYLVKRVGESYTCSCPAWRNQRHAPSSRTCKHLKQVLGDEYEALRVSSSGSTSVTAQKKAAAIKATAPDVLLAEKWDREKHDPTGWWISEKLDGVRAYWNAEKRVFLSRLGNVFPAPDWFTEKLPSDTDLDGELFGGRALFQFTVGIAKTEHSTHWDQLVYKVFDTPTVQKPFEDRVAHAKKVVADAGSAYVEWVEHTKCTSLAHLDEVFDQIEKLGGEGLMVREPGSKYVGGRSWSLLKVKKFHDGEAEVVAHEDGKGKYTGMCGALRCQMASGKMFKVASGLSDKQREDPPAIGSIIVYKCQELTNGGIPRFPVFLGVAADKDHPTDPVIANDIARDE